MDRVCTSENVPQHRELGGKRGLEDGVHPLVLRCAASDRVWPTTNGWKEEQRRRTVSRFLIISKVTQDNGNSSTFVRSLTGPVDAAGNGDIAWGAIIGAIAGSSVSACLHKGFVDEYTAPGRRPVLTGNSDPVEDSKEQNVLLVIDALAVFDEQPSLIEP